MQQLRERKLTNTPTVIPHDCSNCGLSLNSPERVRGSVAGLKTSLNNPDAALTSLRREKGGLMLAYIINKHGKPLMPCHPAKASERTNTFLIKRRAVFPLHPNLMVQDGVSTL